jgi:hypothetical protein
VHDEQSRITTTLIPGQDTSAQGCHKSTTRSIDKVQSPPNMSAEASASTSTPVRILVINPNTSQHMTDALKPVLEDLRIPSVCFLFLFSVPHFFPFGLGVTMTMTILSDTHRVLTTAYLGRIHILHIAIARDREYQFTRRRCQIGRHLPACVGTSASTP